MASGCWTCPPSWPPGRACLTPARDARPTLPTRTRLSWSRCGTQDYHFASWTGTAPIDASSGEHTRHRLSRAGNRRLNHVLYMAGIVQLRNDTPGRAYYRRKVQQSKTSMEAMRCLRRRLSDVVYRQLAADAGLRALEQAGPGGHSGTTLKS